MPFPYTPQLATASAPLRSSILGQVGTGWNQGIMPNIPAMPTLPAQAHFTQPQGMPWRQQPSPVQYLGPPVQQQSQQMGYQPTWGQQGGMAQNQQMAANPNDILMRLQEEFRRRQQIGMFPQMPGVLIR